MDDISTPMTANQFGQPISFRPTQTNNMYNSEIL